MIAVNGGQPLELDTHDGRTAKRCRNDLMLDEFLPKGSAIKPGMLVLDGVKQCGQGMYNWYYKITTMGEILSKRKAVHVSVLLYRS